MHTNTAGGNDVLVVGERHNTLSNTLKATAVQAKQVGVRCRLLNKKLLASGSQANQTVGRECMEPGCTGGGDPHGA